MKCLEIARSWLEEIVLWFVEVIWVLLLTDGRCVVRGLLALPSEERILLHIEGILLVPLLRALRHWNALPFPTDAASSLECRVQRGVLDWVQLLHFRLDARDLVDDGGEGVPLLILQDFSHLLVL